MGTAADQLDLDELRRAIESRDAAAQAAMFADDAEVVVVDHEHPPSNPHHLQGIDEIRAMIEDVCARDLTHEVTRMISEPGGVAYTLDCRYPDGTHVYCVTLLDVRDGKIVRQEGAQAWDEA